MPRSLLLVVSCLLAVACRFEPEARRAQPQLLHQGHARVVRTLDPRGSYAHVQLEREAGQWQDVILRWAKDERCELPMGVRVLSGPLVQAGTPENGKSLLYLPAVLAGDGTSQLYLFDEKCRRHGPYGAVANEGVRTLFSKVQQRSFLLFHNEAGNLLRLDPWAKGDQLLVMVAAQAQRVVLVSTDDGKADDLWLLEDGLLTRRSTAGRLLSVLGEDVGAFALSRSDERRVAYVDGGGLYEAMAPSYRPVQHAADGCAPTYSDKLLSLRSPCEGGSLQQLELESGKRVALPPDTVASQQLEDVRLDYVRTGPSELAMYMQPSKGARRRVEPVLLPEQVFELTGERLAGLDAERTFGVWSAAQNFRPLLDGVTALLSRYRGRTRQYRWLAHHDANGDLGDVSLLSEPELTPKRVARDVPNAQHAGFLIESGAALPNYPFSAPMVVVLEEASPTQADPERYQGKLRVLLMTGEPSAVLADDVSSFALVAAPVPGLLYAVEDGDEQGLWFVAL